MQRHRIIILIHFQLAVVLSTTYQVPFIFSLLRLFILYIIFLGNLGGDTVEPVLKDHPIGHKNVVCQDRWFLVTGSVILKCRFFC